MNQTVSRRTAGYIRSLNCRLTVGGICVRPSNRQRFDCNPRILGGPGGHYSSAYEGSRL